MEVLVSTGENMNNMRQRTSLKAKITSSASSPLAIVIRVPVTCTSLSCSANRAQDMRPRPTATPRTWELLVLSGSERDSRGSRT
jgi:hypothetical protein